MVSSCICCDPPYTVTIREKRYSWREHRDLSGLHADGEVPVGGEDAVLHRLLGRTEQELGVGGLRAERLAAARGP